MERVNPDPSSPSPASVSVTARRRLDADSFRLLVESTTDYVFMLDPEGVVVSCNLGAERITAEMVLV